MIFGYEYQFTMLEIGEEGWIKVVMAEKPGGLYQHQRGAGDCALSGPKGCKRHDNDRLKGRLASRRPDSAGAFG